MERGIVASSHWLTVVAVLGGCTADSGDEGMLIVKNVRADSMCMVAPSDTETFISEGVLDLAPPTGYLFIAQIRSRVTALTGQEDQRTILMKDAKVDLTFPNSTLFSATELADLRTRGVTHFKQLFTGPLAPNGGLTDVGFALVPESVVSEIATKVKSAALSTVEVVATFTIEGDMSGATVASQPFTYPITMGAGVTANVLGNCPLPTGTAVRTGYACNAYQDGFRDCCVTPATGALTCPASVGVL